MSISEESHINLTVSNETRVNHLIITGNLDVDLTKLHVHNSGTFVSNLPGDVQYTLVIEAAGNGVQLYTMDNNNAIVDIAKLSDPVHIPYSDMHYEHKLNTTYSYRFLSDMDTIMLTRITDEVTTSIVLTHRTVPPDTPTLNLTSAGYDH
jgi:hypothetical protein